MSRFFAALGGEGGMAPPEEERAERLRLEATLYELERVEPWEAVTAEALEALKERCRRRLAYLALAPGARRRADRAPVPASAPEAIPAGAPAAERTAAGAEPAEASPTPVTRAPAPAGPGLREFLAERSILIVSYVGAFLLIVATLLFELAAETFGGPVRFAGVFALDMIFGAAAWLCWRSPRLRIVGTTYVAIFALIAPLVFVAAYVFLVLREQGVSVSLAVAVGATSCAALYGTLASRLRSAGYAALSALAVLTAWCGALVAAGLGEWGGVGLTPLAALFSALAFGPRPQREAKLPAEAHGTVERAPRAPGAPREWLALPAVLAELFIHATAALALVWSLLAMLEGLGRGSPDSAERWAMTFTLFGLAAAYAVYGWLSGRWWVAPGVASLTSLGVIAAWAALAAGWWVPSLALVGLAWVYATVAPHLPPRASAGARRALKTLAALQAAGAVLIPATPDPLQAALVSAAAALGIWLAWSSARWPSTGANEGGAGAQDARWWLLYTGALASLAWFWLVKLAVPPPPRPTLLGLLTAFAPLPIVMAAIGAGVGRGLGSVWAVPVYAVAAANALWVSVGLANESESPVAGGTYLAFAVTIYAITWIERRSGGAAVAAGMAMTGSAMLLAASDQAAEWWPPVLAAIPWLLLALGQMREPRWRDEHRLTALVLAGLVALSCFGVPAFSRSQAPGALGALAALWSAALLLVITPGLVPHSRGSALVLAALGSYWITRFLGVEQPWWSPGSGWTYLALAVAAYAASWIERVRGGAPAAATLAAVGAMALFDTSGLASEWWPPVLGAIAWLVYGLGRLRQPSWRHEHRLSAVTLAGLVALGCFGVPAFFRPGATGALSSLAALWSFALLLGASSSGRTAPFERAATVALGSLGAYWVASYLGLENPQWYVVPLGLALLWGGYALRRQDRSLARALSGVGLALLLGTTALQMVDGDTGDAFSIAVLVAESVVALLAGVALRQRIYVLFGAGGAALAALRALLMLLSQVPLFVVFGIAALLLLALAALLAFLRERLGRVTTTTGWADWD